MGISFVKVYNVQDTDHLFREMWVDFLLILVIRYRACKVTISLFIFELFKWTSQHKTYSF